MSNVFNDQVLFNNGTQTYGNSSVSGDLEVAGDLNTTGNLSANSFVKENGTSNQFLKGDGSVDTTTYLTAASVGGTPDNVGGQLVVRNGTGGFSAGIVTATTFVGNGTIPIGGIIMWSGSIATIPTGWALCNGSNGTPDLRSRFIVGATSDASTGVTFNADTGVVSGAYAPGNTGGSVAHQLTIPEMPAHTHTYNQNTNANTDHSGSDTVSNNPSFSSQPTGSTGGNDFHENRPPYYALAFIMRTT